MTEEKASENGRSIGKSIRRHLVNYILIVAAGSVTIMVASTLAKAHTLKAPVDKASSYLASDRSKDLIDQIETSARWESMYPSLKPRRDCLAIRCYARNNQLSKAMAIADAMAEGPRSAGSFLDFFRNFLPPQAVTGAVDRFSYILNQMQIPLASTVDLIFKKQNRALLLTRWSGYEDLTDELKAKGDLPGLCKLLETAKKYRADATFTQSLTQYVEQAQRLAKLGQKMPLPSAGVNGSPFGWAMVKKEGVSIFDSSGSFLTKASKGTILEVSEVRDSKSGKIVKGSIFYRNSKKLGVVARSTDLTLKRGALLAIDQNALNMLLTRAEITQKIMEIKDSAKKRQANANPYTAKYRKMHEDYKVFRSNAMDIAAKHKKATGAARSKYASQLREIKPKKIALDNQLKEIKENYTNWVNSNSQLASMPPEVAPLVVQLQEIEAQLRQIGYM